MATLLDTQTRFLESSVETGFGDWGFFGQETYGTTEKAALAESVALRGRRWPGVSGPNAPVCLQTRIVYAPDVTGYEALIIATYRSPPGLQELYEMLRPGRGRLSFTVSAEGQRTVTRDVETGAPVEGPGEPGQYWQVVRGSNVVQTYRTQIQLETAYPKKEFRLARVLALEGRVNDRPFELMNFGTMQTESCKCLGVETIEPLRTYDLYVQVRYMLEWSGPDRTWNDVKSQGGSWIVRRFQKFDNQVPPQPIAEDFKELEVFIPGRIWDAQQAMLVKVSPIKRKVYKLADFSILQGIRSGVRRGPRPGTNWSLYQGLKSMYHGLRRGGLLW